MTHDLSKFRNLGIMAHIDAGKTTTSERILYYTGRSHKLGEVHEGTAVMDWMVQEQERGITITSAATTTYWKDHRLNLIDTPGHVDFTIEVERSLRVLDGAVAVFDAANGVEPQSETVWRQADKYHVPRIAFLNKMDKVGADHEMCKVSMEQKLNARVVFAQLPIRRQNTFVGVIDLTNLEALVWPTDDQNEPPQSVTLSSDERDEAELYRQELLEILADFDDVLAEAVVSETPVSPEQIRFALRHAVIGMKVVPVFMGSAFRNKGIQPLLDAIVNYLPSPLDVPQAEGVEVEGVVSSGVRDPRDDAPFSAIVFKVMSDPFVGALFFMRIYSGVVKVGDSVLNTLKNKKERVTKILRMHANEREELETAYTGEIVAVSGLKLTTTGDTLCAPSDPIAYESMTFPAPVISLAVEPKSSGDFDKLMQSLNRLSQEDPSLQVSTSEETGQILIAGMGELHLQIIADRLLREFKVNATVGKPQVSYRECVLRTARATETFSRTVQNRTFSAKVSVEISPNFVAGAGVSLVFPEKTVTSTQITQALRESLLGAASSGALCGFPLVNACVTVIDYTYDAQSTDDLVYRVAASNALRNALSAAEPVLMEPIMRVEVVVPQDFSGTIVSDISGRRGQVTGLDTRGHLQVIHAHLPLSELFGYETDIRSLSQGRASSVMQFSHYEVLPKPLQEKILGLSETSST